MNKTQHISKLSIFLFLIISVFFSCDTEEKDYEKDVYVPYTMEIDSSNATKFANLLIEDIYNSDTVNARKKIQIQYNSDSIFVTTLLANEDVFNHFDLFSRLNQHILLGAELEFQNYESNNGGNTIWLRLFTAPMEVNYFRIDIAVANNEIIVTDFTSFDNSINCNDMMIELVDLVFTKKQLSDNTLKDGFRLMDSTVVAFYSFDPDLAELYYSKMDIALRETAIIKSIKFNLDFHSTSEERTSALERKKNETAKNGNSEWSLLARYYLNLESHNYVKVREAIEGLRNSVGEDPVLVYLNGTTYFEEYNYKQAIELYNEALTIDPNIPNIHFAKVICLIEMNEFIQAVESLLVMEDYFDVNNTNWDKEFIAYPKFLISDEYSQWLERVGEVDEEGLL